MKQKPTRRTRIGRPPAGIREGERVKDYPQLSVRVPPDVRAKLAALADVAGVPQWRIVMEALERYLLVQSSNDREAMSEAAGTPRVARVHTRQRPVSGNGSRTAVSDENA